MVLTASTLLILILNCAAACSIQFGICRMWVITPCSVRRGWSCAGEVTTGSLPGTSSSPSWPGRFSSGVFFSKRA